MRRVVDPAGGSWAVESLTDQMAAQAWKQLQDIESRGGLPAVLKDGSLQASIEATRQEKARNIQRRKDVIVGTNTYPNAGEELLKPAKVDYATAARGRAEAVAAAKAARDNPAVVSALERSGECTGNDRMEALLAAAAAGATTAELLKAAGLDGQSVVVKSIPLMRGAGDFEKLRLSAMALSAKGQEPVIHQLNMGPSRRYRIRADWTSAFFQVAGFRLLNDDDYDSVEDAVEALRSGGARVAVITSDDETYASMVGPLAKAVKALDGGIKVLVAGAPGENEEAWREAGVEDFVHVRVNNYTFNRALLESMGAEL